MWAPLKVSLLAGFSLRVAIHLSDVHFPGKMTTNSDFASEFGVANRWKRYDVHVLEAAPFEVKVVQIDPGIWTNKPRKLYSGKHVSFQLWSLYVTVLVIS